ncbi:CoxG family protein [Sulfurisphaera javensis]|uniref:CoxG family protein n=1 Tax=Sulfurisphaera javensis TaxID=2049879 RepID=A0AAT9GS43_9CREN
MKFEGEVQVPITSDKLWEYITQPEKIASCFPGLKNFSKEGDEYKVVGTTGIGFIKGDYKASVKFSQIDDKTRTVGLIAKGNGLNSNVDINATINVLDNPTRLKYTADVKISGILASVGARLMDSAVNKILNDLFECIKTKASSE